jgi:cytochrome c553
MVAGWRVLLGPERRDVSKVHFETTPQRLERGKYLVDSVMACMKCHAVPDLRQAGHPPLPDKYGSGRVLTFMPAELGRVVAPNLTPDPETGIGRMSDDEVARAIREGVGHDQRALFPMMPYDMYRNLADEDVTSIVVYLRSLAPQRNPLPPTELAFPVKYLVRNLPQPLREPVRGPAPGASKEERGSYLAKLASCEHCHSTQNERQQPLPGMFLAGGNVMVEDGPPVTTPNITPDVSGIGQYSFEQFREVMQKGMKGSRKLHPLMPYANYQGMSDEDLEAIFAYLKTVPPVKHWTNATAKATFCPVCNKQHGYGELNH